MSFFIHELVDVSWWIFVVSVKCPLSNNIYNSNLVKIQYKNSLKLKKEYKSLVMNITFYFRFSVILFFKRNL